MGPGASAVATRRGLRVVEHVVRRFADEDGRHEPGAGAVMQFAPAAEDVVVHAQATNGHPSRGQPGSELFEPPGQEPPLRVEVVHTVLLTTKFGPSPRLSRSKPEPRRSGALGNLAENAVSGARLGR